MIGPAVLALALLASACGDDESLVFTEPALEYVAPGTWAIVEVDGMPVVVGGNVVATPYLEIDRNEFNGFFGCNNGGGRYVAEVGQIVFRSFALEASGCIPDERMEVERRIVDLLTIGEGRYESDAESMVWRTRDHEIRFELVAAAPTTTFVEPVRSTWGPLDCGDRIVAEDNRIDGGPAPIEIARRYEPDVAEVVEIAPLQFEAFDADGSLLMLVFVHDDGTDDYQVVYCVDA